MSSSHFECHEHVISCQHIREFYRATANSQEEELQLAVKQYIPLDNLDPKPGDATIIACHGAGFFKELYEPFFDELLDASKSATSSFRIGSIWIADTASHGASSVLNEGKLGIDPCWDDHARDLLHMINIFRSQMRRPLIGIGHSMGATNIVQLALLHPRLFSSVVCIEPILNKEYRGMNFSAAYGLSYRKDVWPSRAAAMAESRKSEVQRTWDERVMKRWECYAFCDLPTLLYPTAPEAIIESAAEGGTSPVTLTTTKHHGVRSYARAAFASPERPLEDLRTSQKSHVGLTQAAFDAMHAPVYRPECIYTFQQLPFLRPSCLFIYGAESHFSNAKPKSRADKLNSTGTSAWGSGGANGGKVGEVVLEGGGHYIVLEKPAAVAGETSRWVDARLAEWQEEDAAERKAWDRVPSKERARVDDAWLFWVKEYYKKTKL